MSARAAGSVVENFFLRRWRLMDDWAAAGTILAPIRQPKVALASDMGQRAPYVRAANPGARMAATIKGTIWRKDPAKSLPEQSPSETASMRPVSARAYW